MISVPSLLAIWASGRIHFWRRNIVFTSQKLKTKYFRNSFRTDGMAKPHLFRIGCRGEDHSQGDDGNRS